MVGYIYLTTDTTNGMQYVGQHHYNKEELDSNYHGSGHIIRQIYKKRPETLKEEYIKTCYSEEEMNNDEKYYIKLYDTLWPNGYNLEEGGRGGVPSEETRRKLSETHKGLQAGEKHPMFGKHHSDESKNKISESQSGEKNHFFGKHHSEETKQKMRDAHKGKSLSEETKIKLSLANKGKHHSEESKQKMRDAHKKRKLLKQLQPDGCLPLW